MPRHPGRVERVDGVSWRESPALAGSLPCPHHLAEGKRGEDEAGRMADSPRPCPAACCWSIGGEVVAMASPRTGRGARPSLSLSVGTSGRGVERLAMVWTVETADRTEERRGTGEEVGGILRPVPLSSWSVCLFVFSALFAFVLSLYNKVYI